MAKDRDSVQCEGTTSGKQRCKNQISANRQNNFSARWCGRCLPQASYLPDSAAHDAELSLRIRLAGLRDAEAALDYDASDGSPSDSSRLVQGLIDEGSSPEAALDRLCEIIAERTSEDRRFDTVDADSPTIRPLPVAEWVDTFDEYAPLDDVWKHHTHEKLLRALRVTPSQPTNVWARWKLGLNYSAAEDDEDAAYRMMVSHWRDVLAAFDKHLPTMHPQLLASLSTGMLGRRMDVTEDFVWPVDAARDTAREIIKQMCARVSSDSFDITDLEPRTLGDAVSVWLLLLKDDVAAQDEMMQWVDDLAGRYINVRDENPLDRVGVNLASLRRSDTSDKTEIMLVDRARSIQRRCFGSANSEAAHTAAWQREQWLLLPSLRKWLALANTPKELLDIAAHSPAHAERVAEHQRATPTQRRIAAAALEASAQIECAAQREGLPTLLDALYPTDGSRSVPVSDHQRSRSMFSNDFLQCSGHTAAGARCRNPVPRGVAQRESVYGWCGRCAGGALAVLGYNVEERLSFHDDEESALELALDGGHTVSIEGDQWDAASMNEVTNVVSAASLAADEFGHRTLDVMASGLPDDHEPVQDAWWRIAKERAQRNGDAVVIYSDVAGRLMNDMGRGAALLAGVYRENAHKQASTHRSRNNWMVAQTNTYDQDSESVLWANDTSSYQPIASDDALVASTHEWDGRCMLVTGVDTGDIHRVSPCDGYFNFDAVCPEVAERLDGGTIREHPSEITGDVVRRHVDAKAATSVFGAMLFRRGFWRNRSEGEPASDAEDTLIVFNADHRSPNQVFAEHSFNAGGTPDVTDVWDQSVHRGSHIHEPHQPRDTSSTGHHVVFQAQRRHLVKHGALNDNTGHINVDAALPDGGVGGAEIDALHDWLTRARHHHESNRSEPIHPDHSKPPPELRLDFDAQGRPYLEMNYYDEPLWRSTFEGSGGDRNEAGRFYLASAQPMQPFYQPNLRSPRDSQRPGNRPLVVRASNVEAAVREAASRGSRAVTMAWTTGINADDAHVHPALLMDCDANSERSSCVVSWGATPVPISTRHEALTSRDVHNNAICDDHRLDPLGHHNLLSHNSAHRYRSNPDEPQLGAAHYRALVDSIATSAPANDQEFNS